MPLVVCVVSQALAVDITPPHKVGQAQGLHRQGGDFVFLGLPPGLGLLADLQGGCELPIAATAGGMVGALGMFWMRSTHSK